MIAGQEKLASKAREAGAPLARPQGQAKPLEAPEKARFRSSELTSIALLTGCADKPYALGLASALVAEGLTLDFIGSDQITSPELQNCRQVNFLNLRGDQRPETAPLKKLFRTIIYYVRLIAYAATARPRVFHILWNNKLEYFDRTALMLYYRLLGKKILFTAHNVNARQRDGNDTFLNRLTLRIQYRLVDHVLVHTEKMKRQLSEEFAVPAATVSVIPFGINDTVPHTALSTREARERLGLATSERVLLFFGHVAPYKGLEYLVQALAELARKAKDYRLIIAGRIKGCPEYWGQVQEAIVLGGVRGQVIERTEYIPDDEVEMYFKAADVLVLPYKHVFQSGVLFLGYGFGLPAIAADVGSLKEEIIEGRTGFVFRSEDAADLAKMIQTYFESGLFRDLERRRQEIRDYAEERYSWTKVATITTRVYLNLLES